MARKKLSDVCDDYYKDFILEDEMEDGDDMVIDGGITEFVGTCPQCGAVILGLWTKSRLDLEYTCDCGRMGTGSYFNDTFGGSDLERTNSYNGGY